PGSAFFLARPLIRDNSTAAGGWGVPRGGMGAIADAIARSARRWGMAVIAGDPVREILVKDGRSRGLALASGHRIAARAVASSADVATTFRKLVDPALL